MAELSKHARGYTFEADGVRLTLMHGVSSLYGPEGLPTDPFHTHSWYELFCACGGRVRLFFEEGDQTLEAGMVAILPPGMCHYAIFERGGGRAFSFSYAVQPLAPTGTARRLAVLHRPGLYRCMRVSQGAEGLAVELAEAIERDDRSLCGAYLFSLLLYCAARISPPVAGAEQDPRAGRIYKIEQTLNTSYTEKLPLTRLAEELHLSTRQLSRVIQSHYGAGYRQKNKQLRMQSAARRLQKGEPIAQVAASEGYSSLSAFYAAFRKSYQLTPAKYQKQFK